MMIASSQASGIQQLAVANANLRAKQLDPLCLHQEAKPWVFRDRVVVVRLDFISAIRLYLASQPARARRRTEPTG